MKLLSLQRYNLSYTEKCVYTFPIYMLLHSALSLAQRGYYNKDGRAITRELEDYSLARKTRSGSISGNIG